jgi:hypothetical protein
MEKTKLYRVFTDNLHEYNITVGDSKEGYPEYSLIRAGISWSESARNVTVLKITNDGDGYNFSKISKSLDYAELAELHTLLGFAHWYESEGSNTSHITIEACEQKLEFKI